MGCTSEAACDAPLGAFMGLDSVQSGWNSTCFTSCFSFQTGLSPSPSPSAVWVCKKRSDQKISLPFKTHHADVEVTAEESGAETEQPTDLKRLKYIRGPGAAPPQLLLEKTTTETRNHITLADVFVSASSSFHSDLYRKVDLSALSSVCSKQSLIYTADICRI
ncbi:uncharacterized protein V6R79_024702 [Siganus canaliculatus]